jgi:hypothetical protein
MVWHQQEVNGLEHLLIEQLKLLQCLDISWQQGTCHGHIMPSLNSLTLTCVNS